MSGDKNENKVVFATSLPSYQCPVLNNKNYTLWALRMKKILMANGVWDLVEGTSTSKEIDVKKDSSACEVISRFQDEVWHQDFREELVDQVNDMIIAKHVYLGARLRIEDGRLGRVIRSKQSRVMRNDTEERLCEITKLAVKNDS
ncbi:hypothetical protein Tco_0543585 [Tanacetum coccineum]